MRPARLLPVFAVMLSFAAVAQAQVTAAQRQLDRIDLAVSGAGLFQPSSTGVIHFPGAANNNQSVTNTPSNTLGALVTLRYVAKPLVGVEVNGSYARFTENYSYIGGVQTNVNEFTLGYVATPKHPIFGFQPFISAGGGGMYFKPTAGGGQGLLPQVRGTYYYSAGLQQDLFGPHLGVRAAFRQVFYSVPDFGQNYLAIEQHTSSIQPTLGVFLRF